MKRFHINENGMLCRDDELGGFVRYVEVMAEIEALKSEISTLKNNHSISSDSPEIESAWNRFNEVISDGPDSPYPDMVSAFEKHYGQKWNDKDWRNETAVWAAAWKASADRRTQ